MLVRSVLYCRAVKDIVVVVSMNAGLAALVTAHLATVYGLLFRPPRWRAAAAFALPVLSPVFAFGEKMRVRGVGFVLGALVYLVTRVVGGH